MGVFRRRKAQVPQRPLDTEEDPEVGGDRMVFWKTEEQIDDVDYGPVWIANLDGEIIEDTGLWLTWEEAEEFARRRELPLEDV
jgi:hypothetical protein